MYFGNDKYSLENELCTFSCNGTQLHTRISKMESNSRDTDSHTSAALSEIPSEIIIKSRITFGSRWSACTGMLMDYSKKTSIHGIRYLFEAHRPHYEKFYWVVVFCFSIYLSVLLIWDAVFKWQTTPVILGFDETLVPIYKIPFPTVTICPEIKMNAELFNFQNISKQLLEGEWDSFNNENYLDDLDLNRFAAALHLCDVDVMEKFIKLIPEYINPDVSESLLEMSVSKNETAMFCKWNGRFYFCDKIFTFIATDEGICYQFNGLRNEDMYRNASFVSNLHEDSPVDFNNYFDVGLPRLNEIQGHWSLDEGYVNQDWNAYPQRTAFSSVRNGFFASLQAFEHNFDYTCRSFKQGYKVYLHSPESVPVMTGNYILVPHETEVMVSVLPQYVTTTESLHSYSPEKRQCYFNDERYLRFFRHYSQSNCQIECTTNYTIQTCGCVKFSMPKPDDVPVCGIADIPCYLAAQKQLFELLQEQTKQKTRDPKAKILCDCMPGCTSLDYNFEISTADYNLRKTISAWREQYNEHPDHRSSRLSISFKEHQFTAIKRTVMFGVTILIANCGGIFGLFMGVSSISVIEIVYFFSIRLVNNMKERQKVKEKLEKQKQGDSIDKVLNERVYSIEQN